MLGRHAPHGEESNYGVLVTGHLSKVSKDVSGESHGTDAKFPPSGSFSSSDLSGCQITNQDSSLHYPGVRVGTAPFPHVSQSNCVHSIRKEEGASSPF